MDTCTHFAWDHHKNPLRYAKSLVPAQLMMGDKSRPVSIAADYSAM
ncbi:MAG: hypothetical protein R6V27_06825 [Balneolaceae bacterium]